MTTTTPPTVKPWTCLRCEHVGPTNTSVAGVFGIALSIVAALTGLGTSGNGAALFLALLGVALATYRPPDRTCRACGSNEVIPSTSPRAQRASAVSR